MHVLMVTCNLNLRNWAQMTGVVSLKQMCTVLGPYALHVIRSLTTQANNRQAPTCSLTLSFSTGRATGAAMLE